MIDSPEALAEMARNIRVKIINTGYRAGAAHFGSSLSCVELLLAVHLFKQKQDCFLLSKGHASLALYAVLETVGTITAEQLASFNQEGTIFYSHHGLHPEFGLNTVNGSLGLGLSFGIGKALAYVRQGASAHVYVLCGNGELNEGSVLESIMFAGANKIKGLTLIVDDNKLQLDGNSKEIMPLTTSTTWFKDLGWQVIEVNGNDIVEVMQALDTKVESGPRLIYAHTVKGKGVSFMEGVPRFHHTALTAEEYQQALVDLGAQEQEVTADSSVAVVNDGQSAYSH